MDRFDYLIVGAGFAGAVCAERLAAAGKRVLVVDQRAHVGGNAYDEYDEHGILVHRYGAHIFHTKSSAIIEYLSRFTEWYHFEHRVLSAVGGQLLPFPINERTLLAFDGDEARAREAMIEPYTRKQWGPYAADLSPIVLGRVKTRANEEDRYFPGQFQGVPKQGYTKLFQRLLASPNIKVLLKTAYREIAAVFNPPYDPAIPARRGVPVIFSGPIDEYFDHCYGRLPYRSADFQFLTYAFERFQPVPVVNHPPEATPFTRIAEFKHLTGQQHPKTTIALEFPTAIGEPFWPVPTGASAALYQQYAALAAATRGVHFVGRLGTFKYLDMDQVIAQALKLSAALLEEPHAHAVA
jgi:UDP-galactopyranose mutase